MKIKLLTIMGLGLLLAACGKSDNTTTQAPQTNQEAAPAVTAPAAQNPSLETKFVTIATGGASGPYNIIGVTLANILSKELNTNSKTQTTGASVENINLMQQGKVELAFVMSDALSDAVNGGGIKFKTPTDQVLQIAALYPNFVQIVSNKNSNIKDIYDLKGKRVAVGAQNSGVEINARTILNSVGISYDDLTVDYLGYAAAADALKSGRIDAAFVTSGLPNAAVTELQQTLDLQMVSIPKEVVEKLAQKFPYFLSNVIPAGTYGNAEDIPTASIKNALIVSAKLSNQDVFLITKTLFENLDKLKAAHNAAKGISLENALEGVVAPIHPGAQLYYSSLKK